MGLGGCQIIISLCRLQTSPGFQAASTPSDSRVKTSWKFQQWLPMQRGCRMASHCHNHWFLRLQSKQSPVREIPRWGGGEDKKGLSCSIIEVEPTENGWLGPGDGWNGATRKYSAEVKGAHGVRTMYIVSEHQSVPLSFGKFHAWARLLLTPGGPYPFISPV